MSQKERIDAEGLLSKINIVDVIGKYVSLTKRGGEWVGQCPFHNDDHASLSVNDRKQIFKCFPCDAGGDAIAFKAPMGDGVGVCGEQTQDNGDPDLGGELGFHGDGLDFWELRALGIAPGRPFPKSAVINNADSDP